MVQVLPAILEALTNPIRAQAILFLRKSNVAKYSELLQACSLHPYTESGRLGYHLQQLISLGLIAKDKSTYTLTEKGRKASHLLETINKKSKELFMSIENSSKRPLKKETIVFREAVYSDLQSLIKLWKMSFQEEADLVFVADEPDYFIAECFVGIEGLKRKVLCHPGYGKGRLTFVAEYEGDLIGYCIVDLMSLAHMKAEYFAIVNPDELPKELRPPLSDQEKEFYEKYWETESKFSVATSLKGYIEVKYGVTGIWNFPCEPIKLTFTRKRLDTDEFVTADIEEIFHEILFCRKLETHALSMRQEVWGATDGGGPAFCFEVFQLFVHSDFKKQEVAEIILKYVESEATKRKMACIVTRERPDKIEARKFWRENGFLEIHQPKFDYKHTGRVDTYLLIKKL